MKVVVIGTGYVGLVTGVCLSEVGHQIVCVDVNEEKIQQLLNAKSPIYEPGLDELLIRNIQNNRLHFSSNLEQSLPNADIVIVAVGTPQGESGAANLSYLESAIRELGSKLQHDCIVIIKSTVPVGTNDKMAAILNETLMQDIHVSIVSNPEFLREGHAIQDTFHGDRIVIGSDNKSSASKVEKLYKDFQLPILHTDRRSAEMIKYAANAFLAMKISFINEVANLCDAVDANVLEVADGMGMDRRIGSAFLNAGIGYGGSCFPKDTEGYAYLARSKHVPVPTIDATIQTNKLQYMKLIDKVKKYFPNDIASKTIAILGLSFKPNTDDIREAPAIKIIQELLKMNVNIKAYDPVVKTINDDKVAYSASIEECVQGSDAVLLVTEWEEFIQADWGKLVKICNKPILLDGRNALPLHKLADMGWSVEGIGLRTKVKQEVSVLK